MKFSYRTRGTCASRIDLEIENGIVKDVVFQGGCNGNLKGISALVKGKPAEEVIPIIKGIKCGFKQTSCPDQLACALEEAVKNEASK